ncbi:MAG TPA: Maf family protein [Bacillota bacterium]
MKQLILASASPRRAELLRQIGLNFKIVVSNVSEDLPPQTTTPEQLVVALALAKAKAAADRVREGVIIGADTVVLLGNQVLGKPASPAEAATMLKALSGKRHQVFTGIAIFEPVTGKLATDYAMTEVVLRPLAPAEIQAYVATGEPLDKAGAYGIQGLGAVLVERIEGCYFNVVGLPLGKLVAMLQGFGISIWQE